MAPGSMQLHARRFQKHQVTSLEQSCVPACCFVSAKSGWATPNYRPALVYTDSALLAGSESKCRRKADKDEAGGDEGGASCAGDERLFDWPDCWLELGRSAEGRKDRAAALLDRGLDCCAVGAGSRQLLRGGRGCRWRVRR